MMTMKMTTTMMMMLMMMVMMMMMIMMIMIHIYIYFDDDDIYVGDVGGSGQLGIPSEPSNQSCSLAAPLIGPVWRLSDRRKKPKKTMPSEIPSMGHPRFPMVVFVICRYLPELMIHRIYVCVSFKHCQQRHNGPKG